MNGVNGVRAVKLSKPFGDVGDSSESSGLARSAFSCCVNHAWTYSCINDEAERLHKDIQHYDIELQGPIGS